MRRVNPNRAEQMLTDMNRVQWFDRQFNFGLPAGILPFYIERLSGTVYRIEAKVRNISEDILSNKLDGKWSVKENIGHLAEVDEIALKRIGEMIAGVSPMSPAVFEPRGDYNKKSIGDVIEYFQKNRTENIKRYEDLSATDLVKSSIHPRLKVPMTPVDLAMFDAEHDDHHLLRISEIISLLTKKN
jgi:hypothetical protein